MSIFSFLFGNKNKKVNIDNIELYPEAVLVFSQDYKLLKLNLYAKKLLNLGDESFDNIKFTDIFDCDFEILIKELLQENNICTLKIKNLDIFVEIKAAQRTPEIIIFSLRDVTQKHKTITSFMLEYETSKKINRTKNNLLIKLSNELTSPLHSITGFSQAMLEGLSGQIDDKQKRYLNVINKNAFDLLLFIELLIESAKLESNSYEFEPKVFDIIDFSNNLLADLKSQNPNLKTISDFSGIEKRTIYTDSVALNKIFRYFISNLLKSNDFGEITIKITHPDIEIIKEHNIQVTEDAQSKSFMHIEITSNEACPSNIDKNMFEIYPQLENDAKRDVLNNLPLYNASMFSKYLNLRIFANEEGQNGFNILLNTEKP